MITPNKLTLSRIVLAPIFVIFFMADGPFFRTTGFLIFVIAALTDIADGHYARKYGIVTGFGKFMDPLADKILVTTAFIGLAALGYARVWMVVLIVAREFYITGLRSLAAYRGLVISPSRIAKVKTFIQMSAIVFMMLIITSESIFRVYKSSLENILRFNHQLSYDIALGASTAITLYTGFDYTVKYYSMLKSILK
jgi:CDP-diacylglycerol--glycerol-3-phosphate 3-phosphatidyltransferase